MREGRTGRRAISFALTAIAAATAAGCAQTTKVETRTVTTAAANVSLPKLVARVKSGVIRIQSSTCDGAAVGTGFLLSHDLVATVEHVVDGETKVVLKRNGSTLATGTVIGADQSRDVALIRTSTPISGYVFKLDSRAPSLGEPVVAFGFPFGLALTVTQGTVSGLNRAIPIDSVTRRRLVQTDAAVNPGNSGGPLLTTDTHEVVGLVDLGTTQANGIAFAVSAAVAKPLLNAWRAAPQPMTPASCGGKTPQASPPPTAPTATGDPASTLDQYWNLLQRNDYADAYQLFSPGEQQRVRGLGEWMAYFSSDPVVSVNADFRSASISGHTAVVDVVYLETIGASTGCRDWAGSYRLVDIRGRWLIDYADLSYQPC